MTTSDCISNQVPPNVAKYFQDREDRIWESGEACGVVNQKQRCYDCENRIDSAKKFKKAILIPIPDRSQYWRCVPTCNRKCYARVMDMVDMAGVTNMEDTEYELTHKKKKFHVRIVCKLPKIDSHGPLVYIKGVEKSRKRKRNQDPFQMIGIEGWIPVEELERRC